MSGHSVHGLTVVISPLQSLMKDQVDNLADRGITDAVTINGLLDLLHGHYQYKEYKMGSFPLIYSPRNASFKTIEKILMRAM